MELGDPTDEDFIEALKAIHRTALGYRGPRAAEFAQIARSSQVDVFKAEESDGLDLVRPPPRDQFAEVLAMLLAIAYPTNVSDFERVTARMAEAIDQPIERISMEDDGQLLDLIRFVAPPVPEKDRELEVELRRFLPLSSLDSQQ